MASGQIEGARLADREDRHGWRLCKPEGGGLEATAVDRQGKGTRGCKPRVNGRHHGRSTAYRRGGCPWSRGLVQSRAPGTGQGGIKSRFPVTSPGPLLARLYVSAGYRYCLAIHARLSRCMKVKVMTKGRESKARFSARSDWVNLRHGDTASRARGVQGVRGLRGVMSPVHTF